MIGHVILWTVVFLLAFFGAGCAGIAGINDANRSGSVGWFLGSILIIALAIAVARIA